MRNVSEEAYPMKSGDDLHSYSNNSDVQVPVRISLFKVSFAEDLFV